VSRYARAELQPEDIRRWLEVGLGECFAQRDPALLEDEGACLPLSLGRDVRNGKTLELHYTCSDLCPQAGGVMTAYARVDERECCAVGGLPAREPASRGYRGCHPPELRQPRQLQRKVDGGALEPAFRNPCDGGWHFDDGTVVPGPPPYRPPLPDAGPDARAPSAPPSTDRGSSDRK
jgi:hypothetical protein